MPIKLLPVFALLAGLALGACSVVPASGAGSAAEFAAADALKAFPESMDGHRRFVIELPPQPDENSHRVELYATKTMTVDCNTRGMDGRFERVPVPGWGYDYWVLHSGQQVVTTLMACPPDSEKPGRVQTAPSELLRYNSRLPLVVFVPEGLDLSYRIWSAAAERDAPVR